MAVALLTLPGCDIDMPTIEDIRDSKLLDRRIHETPRQKVVRECQQEAERYRVACTHCHTTSKLDDIKSPDLLRLNPVGVRAQIMRKSPTFGMNQDCIQCHQTKFRLNRAALKLFGPGGIKVQETAKDLKVDK